jgi:hypothetical protein
MALGLLAATPAKADFSVIRWTSGWCQIWDNSVPTQPWPSDYTVVAAKLPNWSAAWAALHGAIASRKCGW